MRTANEVEALVLENELIKHYRPRFNIRLKDDKNFLYLKLPVREDYPRVHYTRRINPDGAIYFGPYTSTQGLRQTVKSIRQLLPFRTCSDDVFRQGRVGRDDQDLVAYARAGKDVFVEVAYVRSGKMVGHDGHALEGELEVSEAELLRSFLVRYYSSATHIPRTIVLPAAIDEAEPVREWL